MDKDRSYPAGLAERARELNVGERTLAWSHKPDNRPAGGWLNSTSLFPTERAPVFLDDEIQRRIIKFLCECKFGHGAPGPGLDDDVSRVRRSKKLFTRNSRAAALLKRARGRNYPAKLAGKRRDE